ncbi:MAG: hypothetical protein HYR96_14505 [Deltaproteobacteria bacterium]|nr:hypothetical protein [Deltaproteobacteria bacterium]MBI3295512.1 hypothetical protein [Deltaproteobacteria bacterium]
MDIKSVQKMVDVDIKATSETRDRNRKEQSEKRKRSQKSVGPPGPREADTGRSEGDDGAPLGQSIDSERVLNLLSRIPAQPKERVQASFESRRATQPAAGATRKIDKAF